MSGLDHFLFGTSLHTSIRLRNEILASSRLSGEGFHHEDAKNREEFFGFVPNVSPRACVLVDGTREWASADHGRTNAGDHHRAGSQRQPGGLRRADPPVREE